MRIEAEQMVLALILKDNSNLAKVKSYLTSQDFIEPLHRKLFDLFLELYSNGIEIDLLNVQKIAQEKQISIPIQQLIEFIEVPILEDITTAARAVKEDSIRRSLVNNLYLLAKRIEKKPFLNIQEELKKIENKAKLASSYKWESAEELIGNTDELLIKEFFPLSVKVQLGTVWGIVGATSAGKTEIALDIASNFCLQSEDNVVFYAQYEGIARDFKARLIKKKIIHSNFYFSIKPNFRDYLDFVETYKDKNIFIVVDYLQMYARRIQNNDKHISDQLRRYVNRIYQFFDDLRVQYPNISVCLLCSLSKSGITSINNEKEKRLLVLNGIKESGDVQYDLDYCYCVFFSDDLKQVALSRIDQATGQTRKYMALCVAKPNRTGKRIKDVIFTYNIEGARYEVESFPF